MQDNVIRHMDDIQAERKTLKDIFKDHCTLDYYQREYNWKKEHIDQLIDDLITAFRDPNQKGHLSKKIKEYGTYYLGPLIFGKSEQNQQTIVDGQQRLTSLTLLLIHLNHQQKRLLPERSRVYVENLVYDDEDDTPVFRIQDEERHECMKTLLDEEEYRFGEQDSTSVKNIARQYDNIKKKLKDDFWKEDNVELRLFLRWLTQRTLFVKIAAATPDKAYLIFETVNNRGLTIGSVDMLKAYLISKVESTKQYQISKTWQQLMQKLNELPGKKTDEAFFQAWLRGRYAESIRDFEEIGGKFHTWVRKSGEFPEPESWYDFINDEIKVYAEHFLEYRRARKIEKTSLGHLYRVDFLGFADSLFDSLILAPIEEKDSPSTVKEKMNLVARYVEAFCVRRKVNFRSYSHSPTRIMMYNLMREIRHKDIPVLKNILREKLGEMEDKDNKDYLSLNGITNNEEGDAFVFTGSNGPFVRFFLACLIVYIEQKPAKYSSFGEYIRSTKKIQIEHILAKKGFIKQEAEYREAGYKDEKDFDKTRRLMGGLLLIDNNPELSDLPFGKKATFYATQNLLARSLCARCYSRKASFIRLIDEKKQNLPFKWYADDPGQDLTEKQKQKPYMSPEAEKQQKLFSKNAVLERQQLYQAIAEKIWGLDAFEDD